MGCLHFLNHRFALFSRLTGSLAAIHRPLKALLVYFGIGKGPGGGSVESLPGEAAFPLRAAVAEDARHVSHPST
jgi:hypothetical protein